MHLLNFVAGFEADSGFIFTMLAEIAIIFGGPALVVFLILKVTTSPKNENEKDSNPYSTSENANITPAYPDFETLDDTTKSDK
jgi:hypothetical protein